MKWEVFGFCEEMLSININHLVIEGIIEKSKFYFVLKRKNVWFLDEDVLK